MIGKVGNTTLEKEKKGWGGVTRILFHTASIEVLATFQNVQKHRCWNAWTQGNSGAGASEYSRPSVWILSNRTPCVTIQSHSQATYSQPSLNPPYVHISNPLLQTSQHINHVSLSIQRLLLRILLRRQLPVDNKAHWTNQWSDFKLSLNTLKNPHLLIVFKNLLNKLPPAIKNRTNCVKP